MSDSPLQLSAHDLLTTTRSVRKRLDLDRPVAASLIRKAGTLRQGLFQRIWSAWITRPGLCRA